MNNKKYFRFLPVVCLAIMLSNIFFKLNPSLQQHEFNAFNTSRLPSYHGNTHTHNTSTSIIFNPSLQRLDLNCSQAFPEKELAALPVMRIDRVYVTLISSYEYIFGAQILVGRLRAFSPDHRIIAFLDKSVFLSSSQDAYFQAVQVELRRVENPSLRLNSTRYTEVRSGTYTKLHIWDLQETKVKKAMYLDADTLPIQSPEPYFDLLEEGKNFVAYGDVNYFYFNSGTFVYRPSTEIFHELLFLLETGNYKKEQGNPTEQDLLISYFGTKKSSLLIGRSRMCRRMEYNYRPMHSPKKMDESAVILHWIGNPKPWSYILGKSSSIEGLSTQSIEKILPNWSLKIYQCEMERFFTQRCHPIAPSNVSECRTRVLDYQRLTTSMMSKILRLWC